MAVLIRSTCGVPVPMPAPYKGTVYVNEDIVVDATVGEVSDAFGGIGAYSGLVQIIPLDSGDPRITTLKKYEVDQKLTDADTSVLIANETGYASAQRIEVSTTTDIATVVLSKSATGADIEPGLVYTICHVGRNAGTNNIRISCPGSGTFAGSTSSTYTIDVNGGSVEVYKSAATGRFVALPGMGSGGGGGASADTGEIVTAATTSGSKHALTMTKTISKPAADAPAFFELPAAASATAYADYIVKDGGGIAATHNITVSSAGGAIDGATAAVISANYGSLSFISDGTSWSIV